MKTVLPREQAVEDIFSRILASPEASGRLRKVFYQYLDDEHMLVDEDPDHFLQVLFHAYQNGDVSALLLELCGKSMFDLLREAYLIPRKFHGKAGENPVLLTNVEGELLPEAGKMVSAHEYEKFKETFDRHGCVSFAKAGKKVAAICAAPSVLASLGLLEGRNATAHAGFQDKLAGAIVHDEEVVVDGSITTSYGLGGAIPFALELVRQLAGPAEADRIQKAIAYRH